jgi:diketogulonate reductase-like aldo/keto reductase
LECLSLWCVVASRAAVLETDLCSLSPRMALPFPRLASALTECRGLIPAALNAGVRHFDTAQIYRNEAEVGECVAASGLKRKDVFLTTKVWVANYPDCAFAASVDQSLRKLRTDYLDLLLLHWPSDATSSLSKSRVSTAPYRPAKRATSASATSTGR